VVRRGKVSLVVPAAAEEVFDLVHDYGRRLEWDTLLRAAYLTDGHCEAGVGVTSVCVGRRALGGVALATRYVSFRRGKVAAVEMLRPTFLFARWAASIVHAEIGPNESQITYTYSFRARPHWLAWLIEPPLGLLFRWETSKRLRALRRHFAARRAQPPSDGG
jgi:hypothetical protein